MRRRTHLITKLPHGFCAEEPVTALKCIQRKKKRDKQTPDSKVAFFVLRVLPKLNEYTAAYDRG